MHGLERRYNGAARYDSSTARFRRTRLAGTLGALVLAGTIPAGAQPQVRGNGGLVYIRGSHESRARTLDLRDLSATADSGSACDSLRYKIWSYQGSQAWQQVYDTTKKFIENCYNDYFAPSMFQEYSAGLQVLARSDTGLWHMGRKWLESVLYLNTTNPDYFCKCVEAIAGTFHTTNDTGGEEQVWHTMNEGLAITRWLIENTVCDTPELQNEFYGARASQYEDWRNDTTVGPLDTTIPPLDSVEPGLKQLLEKHFLYAAVNPVPTAPDILSNVSASPNPAESGTVISFTMNKEAYVRITLYDVLGKQLGASAFESFFQPGNKSVPISLADLPSGTYYARIQTAYGEVQTVKLVKQ